MLNDVLCNWARGVHKWVFCLCMPFMCIGKWGCIRMLHRNILLQETGTSALCTQKVYSIYVYCNQNILSTPTQKTSLSRTYCTTLISNIETSSWWLIMTHDYYYWFCPWIIPYFYLKSPSLLSFSPNQYALSYMNQKRFQMVSFGAIYFWYFRGKI